jgi:anti-sigma factor RsiW
MRTRAGHPSRSQIEAAVFGQLGADDAARVRAHAAECPTCGPRLAQEEDTLARLQVLKQDPPKVDVVQQVLERLEVESPDGQTS